MCLFLLFPLLSKLLRARSPSAAAWLTCPRWSRRRTSWRSPSWCRRNNATREKKLKEPTQLNPARRGRRTLEMLQASWRKQHSGGKKSFYKMVLWTLWFRFRSFFNQCFDSVRLIVARVRAQIHLQMFSDAGNLHNSDFLKCRGLLPCVGTFLARTLPCVRHHVALYSVSVPMPPHLAQVMMNAPPSPRSRQLGERVNKHNKPLL